MNLNVHVLPRIDVLRMEIKANGELCVLAPPSLDDNTLGIMVHLVCDGEFRYINIERHQVQPTWIHYEFQVNRSINHLRSGGLVDGPLLELTTFGCQLIILKSYRNLDRILTSWILEKTLFPGEVVFQFYTTVMHDVWFHIRAWEPMVYLFSYFERSRAIRAGDVLYVYNRTTISYNDIPALINMRSGVEIEVILIRRPVWQLSNGRS
ncbi:uncharacterized protein [Rhodnius prolixus]|uniref:uncharacterized protein n=1 Tax=Rhodnius prolixus TaxID=13249 RepID=UPI003D189A82